MIHTRHSLLMQQLGRTYRTFVAGFEAHTGHSLARWRIMVLLDVHGKMSQKALARELEIDPAALTRQIKGLERQAWVRRYSDEQDARLTIVELTKAGQDAVDSAMTLRNEYLEWVLGDFSEQERQSLSDMLAKLESRIAERP